MVYHIHIGVAQFFVIFVGSVLLWGTGWRLIAVHLMDSQIPLFQQIGAAMHWMY